MKKFLKWMLFAFIVALCLVIIGMGSLDHRLHNNFNRTIVDTKYLKSAVTSYKKDFKRFPTEKEGLQALVTNLKNKKYLGKMTQDRWDADFIYKITPNGFLIYSIGPDGVDANGLGDDVTSEQKEYNCKLYNNCPKIKETILQISLVILILSFAGFCLGVVYMSLSYIFYEIVKKLKNT